jgi:hypothetical protein
LFNKKAGLPPYQGNPAIFFKTRGVPPQPRGWFDFTLVIYDKKYVWVKRESSTFVIHCGSQIKSKQVQIFNTQNLSEVGISLKRHVYLLTYHD